MGLYRRFYNTVSLNHTKDRRYLFVATQRNLIKLANLDFEGMDKKYDSGFCSSGLPLCFLLLILMTN